MTYLGSVGPTGRVLGANNGVVSWSPAAPSLIWEADFTTGQTAQTWTAGSTYAVVGSNGTGNINFKHNGGPVPNTVVMVAASGLEVTYATGVTNPSSSIHINLSQLSIGSLLSRPWRMWMYYTYSGTITAGGDNQNICIDLDGTGATNSSGLPTNGLVVTRIYNSSGNAFVETVGFGTDYLGSPGAASWYSADVIAITCASGHISTAWGEWSSGFPAITAMRGMNAGSIQQGKINPGSPYALNTGICFRLASGGATTMTNRKVIIKAMKFEGL